MLVAYFSWGGDTRRVAELIQKKAGGDLFEIEPAKPYSSDYDECLKEANAEKKAKAKVELGRLLDPQAMAQHQTVVVGCPNWLQSIPRPVASFLSSYEWAGKKVLLYCCHGGGGVGQMEAEVAKLCSGAKMAGTIALFKGGGETLEAELGAWLGRAGLA